MVPPCGLLGCTSRVGSISWPEVIKGVSNQDVVFLLARAVVSVFCLRCMWCFVSLFLVVGTGTIECRERLRLRNDYCMSSGMLNPTHSLTHSVPYGISSNFCHVATVVWLVCWCVNVQFTTELTLMIVVCTWCLQTRMISCRYTPMSLPLMLLLLLMTLQAVPAISLLLSKHDAATRSLYDEPSLMDRHLKCALVNQCRR